jgi:anti-sigma factor RsiW
MKHLTESELSAWIDGVLEPGARREAERHLAACAECRAALAGWEAQDRDLARLLEHDPGEAYFASFADRVSARILIEGRSPAAVEEAHVLAGSAETEEPHESAPLSERRLRQAGPPVGKLLETIGRWLSGPRLAWVGAAAAVLASAGVVFLISRENAVRALQDRNLSVRSQVESRVPAPPSASSGTAAKEQSAQLESAPSTPGSAAPPSSGAGGAVAGGAANDRVDRGPSATATAPAPAPTLARRESGTTPEALSKTEARSRPMQRAGGEDVPVASRAAAPASPSAESPLQVPAPTSRLAKIKQSQQGAAPLQAGDANRALAPQDAKMVERDGGQMARLCGTVRDAEGRPIPNAQVGFSDAPTGVTTDASGRWCLDTAPGERTLTIMAVGFRESRRTLQVSSSAEGQDVTLAAVPVMEGGGASGLLGYMSRGSTPWPASVASFAADAERAMASGVRRGSAADFDRAAQSWERVANAVRQGPVGVTARRNLADARYRAWQTGVTPQRSIAAISALSSYLRVAPASDREAVQSRLEEVRKR